MSQFFQSREWMDRRIDLIRNCVSEEFIEGINVFLSFACNQASYEERNTLLCPCARCKNRKQRDARTVSSHLFRVGFKENYYVWSSHGENCYDVGESSRENHFTPEEATWDNQGTTFQVPVDTNEYFPYGNDVREEQGVSSHHILENMTETTHEEAYHDSVFRAFEAANQPLYDGCIEGISQLYVASRMLKAKTDYNLAEACVDEISHTLKAVLPKPNKCPTSYYEAKKLTRALGLPVHKIDVCEDNCMLFWKGEDRALLRCRFCGKDRYHPNSGKGKNRPKQRMFYMPITERLKWLYQLETSASHMRWHAEHKSPEGEMHHPSDGAAWKHFNEMVESGLEEPPPFTELVRKTHTRKDGTFVDPRAEAIVLDVEAAVTDMTTQEGSPNNSSQTISTAATSRLLLNQEYLKRGQTSKGRIYGIGSVQDREISPSETAPTYLKRNLDVDMRISNLETEIKSDMSALKGDMGLLKGEFKEEMAATRAALNAILQNLGVNPSNVPSVPASTTTAPAVPASTTTAPAVPAARTTTQVVPSVPAIMTTPTVLDNATPTGSLPQGYQTNLEKWCANILGD